MGTVERGCRWNGNGFESVSDELAEWDWFWDNGVWDNGVWDDGMMTGI